MPLRTDEQILQMTLEAMAAGGEVRCLFLSGLIPLVGLTDRQAADAFFPFDTQAYRDGMSSAFEGGKTSSCGLTTEAGWRYAGVSASSLYEPYSDRVSRGKYVVAEEMAIAKAAGTWVSAIPWIEGTPLPDVGDAPIIGCTSCGDGWARNVKNLEHIYNVACYDPIGNGVHHSIDGGQPGIKWRTRALVQVFTGETSDGRRQGELWAAAVDDNGQVAMAADGRPVTGRRFIGYVSVPGLPRGAPEGPCIASSSVASLVKRSAKPLFFGGMAVGLAYLLGRMLRK